MFLSFINPISFSLLSEFGNLSRAELTVVDMPVSAGKALRYEQCYKEY